MPQITNLGGEGQAFLLRTYPIKAILLAMLARAELEMKKREGKRDSVQPAQRDRRD
ncbi:hypothetical protein [Pectobacterium cacticida]|uniref:hypothetical protein n=1 Tax=Pectobacterium cacticida TaxID=69221 RepID=UPI003985A2A7